MKRLKRMGILTGVLLCLCVVILIILNIEEKKEDIKNTNAVILDLDTASVTALSWKYGDTELAFHKVLETAEWLYDTDEAFPVDEDAIHTVLEVFEGFGASFVIENVENYGQYGLSDPECEITITTAEAEYQIALGAFSTLDSLRYVSLGDGNVYLVNKDPMDSYETELDDFFAHDSMPEFESVQELIFSGEAEYSIFYEEDNKYSYCEEDVYFTTLGDKTLPLDTTDVEEYVETVLGLDLSAYVSYNATAEELEKYGFDTPALVAKIKYIKESEDNVEVIGELKLTLGLIMTEAEEGEEAQVDKAYVRVNDSSILYEITKAESEALLAYSYDDLRHRELLTTEEESISKVEILLDEESIVLSSEKNAEDKLIWKYEEETLDTELAEEFVTALLGLTAGSFTSELPAKSEEISLVVHLKNTNVDQINIELYRYDGSNCLAVIDGESVALVSRALVVDLIEAVNGIVLN